MIFEYPIIAARSIEGLREIPADVASKKFLHCQ